MKYLFKDLVDVPTLSSLLKALYSIAGIPSAIIDMEGEILSWAGRERICEEFHRKHPIAVKACIESDVKIRREIKEGKPYSIYKCPHGLIDSCSPIIIENHHVANLFTGQLLHSPVNEETILEHKQLAKQYGFDEDDYIAALKEVRVFPRKQHVQILKFLSGFAQLIARLGLIQLRTLEQSKAVIEGEEKYHKLFSNEIDAISIFDIKTRRFWDVNKAFLKLYGYARDEVQLLTIDEVVGEIEKAKKTFNKLDTKTDSHTVIQRHKKKDGTALTVELYSGSFTWKGKKVNFAVTRDITDSIQAEEDLKTIFDLSVDMVCIAEINGCFRKINPAFSKILGYNENELLEKPYIDFIHPDDKSITQKVGVEKLSKGEPVICFTNRYLCKDGQYKWLEWVSRPVPSKGLTYAIARDVTRRKRVSEALEESERKYSALFESSEFLYYLADSNAHILLSNTRGAKLFGHTKETIIGKSFLELRPDRKAIFKNALDTVLSSGETFQYESVFSTPESSLWLSVSVSPVKIGEETQLQIVAQDISKRKQVEEELKEREATLKHAHHELEKKNKKLAESYVALKFLMEQREEDKRYLEEQILFNAQKLILPYLEKVQETSSRIEQATYLDLIKTNLNEIVSPFAPKVGAILSRLSPAEIKIVDLIKHGKSNKEIASLLHLAPSTITTHRKKIRKKLGLTNQKINLRTLLEQQ